MKESLENFLRQSVEYFLNKNPAGFLKGKHKRIYRRVFLLDKSLATFRGIHEWFDRLSKEISGTISKRILRKFPRSNPSQTISWRNPWRFFSRNQWRIFEGVRQGFLIKFNITFHSKAARFSKWAFELFFFEEYAMEFPNDRLIFFWKNTLRDL